MNADAMGLEGGGIPPVLSAMVGGSRARGANALPPALRLSALLDAAARVGATRCGAIESSPAMAKPAAQFGTRTDRNGGKLTQEQLDARAQQRTEDDDLIREAQRGDRSAFDSLVRRYDQPVLRLALHMLSNEQDAQDVHQEAFLKAYRHLGNFRFECSFYTWLYRIVTNLCLDHLRRRKSRREDPATVLDARGDEMDLLSNITDTRAMANPARELDRKRMGECIHPRAGQADAARTHGLRAEALPGTEAAHHWRDVEHHRGDGEEYALPRDSQAANRAGGVEELVVSCKL